MNRPLNKGVGGLNNSKNQPSKFKIQITMAKKTNAKREAFQKKQEQQGKNIVMWIIGFLIALGLIFAVWTSLG